MGLQIGGRIEKVNGKDLSYSDFVDRYLLKNKPVIVIGLMNDWRACKDWVFEDGKPNLQFISSNFGNSKVQVADCGTRDFTDQKRLEMSVSEFIDQSCQLSSTDCDSGPGNEFKGKTLMYLKDWHFVKEYPEYIAYTTPLIFRDDWLNLYLDQYHMHENLDTYQTENELSCSDYRFVYMGAKGTWTPFHADVFRSYSWSANVCGKKHWYFLSPEQAHLVFDRDMKSSVYDIFEEVSETKFPHFKKAIWLECTQDQNEIIFVPSGWYHQVHNLEDTISINHNWFNAYNLSWVWDLLLRDYKEAAGYIEDIKDICDDFEGLCQRNLAANTGMNFYDFFNFMVRLCLTNILSLYHLAKNTVLTTRCLSQRAQHLIFNLRSAQDIALKMKFICLTKTHVVSGDLRKTLEDPTFLDLCTQFERTYTVVHEQCVNDDIKNYLVDNLDMDICKWSTFMVYSPEDLVILVDDALKKLVMLP